MDWSVKKCKNSEECEQLTLGREAPTLHEGCTFTKNTPGQLVTCAVEGGRSSLGRMMQCVTRFYEDCAIVCMLSSGINSAIGEER